MKSCQLFQPPPMASKPIAKQIASNLDCKMIYELDNKLNYSWIFYKPYKSYYDPIQLKKAKQQSLKKSPKVKRQITKKGSFLDDFIKLSKQIPSSDKYSKHIEWSKTFKSSLDKKDINKKKDTYIDRIQMEEKLRKKPDPTTYQIGQTQKQLKKRIDKMKHIKLNMSPKRWFYQETQYLADNIPGPGTHNIHVLSFYKPLIKKFRFDKTNPKYWIQKDQKQKKDYIKKQNDKVCVGFYKPLQADISTFQKIRILSEKNNKISSKKWGTDSRFTYNRQKKTKKQELPSPAQYNMSQTWFDPIKKQTKNYLSSNWMNKISKGISKSVYY